MAKIVDINTSLWNDTWFHNLGLKERLLYLFLYTNDSVGVIGMYRMQPLNMAACSGIDISDLPDVICKLSPKVEYDFVDGVVWVVDFFCEQYLKGGKLSPKMKTSADKAASQFASHSFHDLFINHQRNIGYRYPIDRVKGKGKGSSLNSSLEYSEEFEESWLSYPQKRRGDKSKVSKAWGDVVINADIATSIIKGIESHKKTQDWMKNDGQFIPSMLRFLNERRWEHDVDSASCGYDESAKG